MRAVRLLVITVLIVSPILILALSDSKLARQPFAQVTAAPGPVSCLHPSLPVSRKRSRPSERCPRSQRRPVHRPLAAASVAPTPRAFRCTCGAPGTWTEWAGVVSSSSYVLASQSARGAMRQLPAERERAVAVHSAPRDRPRTSNGRRSTTARRSRSARRWQPRWDNPFSSRARRKRYKVRSARDARVTERSSEQRRPYGARRRDARSGCPVQPCSTARLLGWRRPLGKRCSNTKARRSAPVRSRSCRYLDRGSAPIGRGAGVPWARGALGIVDAALDFCGWLVDARHCVRGARRGRSPMGWTLQASEGNTIRVVGHLALRTARRAARTRGPACRDQRSLTG